MNINKPTQFGPGDTAYTNTVLDNIMGEQHVNEGRNLLQQLLFNPVADHPIYSPIMEGMELFKKPVVADFLRELLGIPSPQQHSLGSEYYDDLNINTDKQQELLRQQRYEQR